MADALADETGGTRGYLLPVPRKDGGDATLNTLKADLKVLKGRSVPCRIAAGELECAGGHGKPADPKQWEPRRMGANPPDALVKLAEQAAREVLDRVRHQPGAVQCRRRHRGPRGMASGAVRRDRPARHIVAAELTRSSARPQAPMG